MTKILILKFLNYNLMHFEFGREFDFELNFLCLTNQTVAWNGPGCEFCCRFILGILIPIRILTKYPVPNPQLCCGVHFWCQACRDAKSVDTSRIKNSERLTVQIQPCHSPQTQEDIVFKLYKVLCHVPQTHADSLQLEIYCAIIHKLSWIQS